MKKLQLRYKVETFIVYSITNLVIIIPSLKYEASH
jgi:hypothetical protein